MQNNTNPGKTKTKPKKLWISRNALYTDQGEFITGDLIPTINTTMQKQQTLCFC